MIVTIPTFLIWIITSLAPVISESNQMHQQTLYATIYTNRKIEAWSEREQILTGLAISTDQGNTWRSVGWKNAPTNDFCIHPSDHSTIFLACDNGVLRSRDDGQNWKLVTPWFVTLVKQIKIHPKKAQRIIAGTAKGIFISEDEGDSWKESSSGLRTPDDTFISSVVFPSDDMNEILIGTENGLYRSIDGGLNWLPFGLQGKAVRSLVQHPANKNLWAAATARNGIYLSINNGSSWEQRNSGLLSELMFTVSFDPSSEKIIYCSSPNYGIYKSIDGGKSWMLRSRGLTNMTVVSLCVDPTNTKRIIAGTKTGSFISDNDGENWKDFTLRWTHVSSLRFE